MTSLNTEAQLEQEATGALHDLLHDFTWEEYWNYGGKTACL